MTPDDPTAADAPLSDVEDSAQLEALVRALRDNPLLRAVQVVSSQRISPAGHETGYDAQLLFQSDRLSSQPLEVRLGAVIKMAIEGAAIADASEVRGHIDEVGVTLELRGARFVAAKVAYRMFPGAHGAPDPAVH